MFWSPTIPMALQTILENEIQSQATGPGYSGNVQRGVKYPKQKASQWIRLLASYGRKKKENKSVGLVVSLRAQESVSR